MNDMMRMAAGLDHAQMMWPSGSEAEPTMVLTRGAHPMLPTSIGPMLMRDGDFWAINVSEVPMMYGLSVLSRALAEMVVHQGRGDQLCIGIERRLRRRENPELIDTYGIESVRLVAEPSMLEALAKDPDTLERRLRSLLGNLRRQRYREALLPEDPSTSEALVSDFGRRSHRYVLEYVRGHAPGRGIFRITIEDAVAGRLALASIPHVRVDDSNEHNVIAGSTRIAQTWAEAIRREAERGRRSFAEQRSPYSHLFKQFDQAGLSQLQAVSFQWSEDAQVFVMENEPEELSELLKRVLLAAEDRQLRQLVMDDLTVRVDAGPVPVYLSTGQLGRVLELSIGAPRERASADDFLARMPRLTEIAEAGAAEGPLSGVRVFLVHHMTAEVVGTIAAMRALGCRDLVCLFVSYSGEPPASYLDAVLDLPPDEVRTLALTNVPDRGCVEGHYRLSSRYSQLEEAPQIERALRGNDREYLKAMRAAAVVPFLYQVERAAAAGDTCLLVEDGGYIAPVLQDALLRGNSTREFAAKLGFHYPKSGSLRALVGPRLLATVEHTRNGYDRLVAVQEEHGAMAVPTYSIAVSKHKREIESREVAASVLAAVETVLHAEGRILSRRSPLVLGSRGAIGRELVSALRHRLDDPHVLAGIDLMVGQGPAQLRREAREPDQLPLEHWLDTDMVLGVTAKSVLQGEHLERWLLEGHREFLVLASGSTKKFEFRDLMEWYDALCSQDAPAIGGQPVHVYTEELLDPRTTRLYGHRWQFRFADGRTRTVLALGNLTPINFMFYGVATELIDEVLGQLLTVSVGAVRNGFEATVPRTLMAVDHEVDEHGRLLPPPRPERLRPANGAGPGRPMALVPRPEEPPLTEDVLALIERLDLKPHPEGGYYRETWRDTSAGTERGHGTAIYFLLPGGVESHWHRVDAAELWHHYAGAPLELSIADDPKAPDEVVRLGPDIAGGELPQGIVPAHAWQSARSTGDWTLVGCTVCPGFQFEGFELLG